MTPNYPPTIYTCYSDYYFNQSKTVCISHIQVFSCSNEWLRTCMQSCDEHLDVETYSFTMLY